MVSKGEDQGIGCHSMKKTQLVSNCFATALGARRQCSNDFNPRMFSTVKLLNVSRRQWREKERERDSCASTPKTSPEHYLGKKWLEYIF